MWNMGTKNGFWKQDIATWNEILQKDYAKWVVLKRISKESETLHKSAANKSNPGNDTEETAIVLT